MKNLQTDFEEESQNRNYNNFNNRPLKEKYDSYDYKVVSNWLETSQTIYVIMIIMLMVLLFLSCIPQVVDFTFMVLFQGLTWLKMAFRKIPDISFMIRSFTILLKVGHMVLVLVTAVRSSLAVEKYIAKYTTKRVA